MSQIKEERVMKRSRFGFDRLFLKRGAVSVSYLKDFFSSFCL